jgi:L-seryl-tRNA(Ser) seleniumtransferase
VSRKAIIVISSKGVPRSIRMSYPYESKNLKRLGVRSWINAHNWATRIGGCWISDKVLEAMDEVAKTFVDMHELITKADTRIAELCHVDDAHVTCGAAAAIELTVAGCMIGDDTGKWLKIPHAEAIRNEVVMHVGHCIAYAPQWIAPGAKIVTFGQGGALGYRGNIMEDVISDKTCCLSYTESYNNLPRGILSKQKFIETGKKHNLPLVIDAASMLPPVSNLWKYTDMGFDIACFSGGKAIQGPNNTGMILGNGQGAKIVEAIRNNSFPHDGWARSFKVSKEQIVGLVVALEEFIENGEALYEKQMKIAEYLVQELNNIQGVKAVIIPNDETFHEHPVVPHVPRVLIEWDEKDLGLTSSDVDRLMAAEDPPIRLRSYIYYDYHTNKAWTLIETFTLREEESRIVAERLKRLLSTKKKNT